MAGPRKVRDLTIVGEQRMVVYDDTQNDEPIKVYDKGVVVPESAEFGEHQLTYRYGDTLVPHVSAAEPLGRQLLHFLEACETGRPTRSDGWFGCAWSRPSRPPTCRGSSTARRSTCPTTRGSPSEMSEVRANRSPSGSLSGGL